MQEQQPTQVPIEMMDADQLPRETPLKYEEVCFVVGSLYLDSHLRMKLMKEQMDGFRDVMSKRMQDLVEENMRLKQELQHGQGPQHSATDSVPDRRQDKVPSGK
jgi:hypothetical protein